MPTQAKIEKVAKIKDCFERAETFFVTDYQGLNVAEMTALRAKLRDSEAQLVIEKNTLIRVAARELGITGLDELLTGPTAIAFAFGDPVAPAKALNESFKKRELPKVRALRLSGELLDGSRISDLADLPSWEELVARVIGNIEAPITRLYAVMSAPTQELIGTLDALAAKVGEAA
ncbi:MAG TPA: 50S ribosomal protein L10 [candidate division Zixibacteria bacterium]|nr:50S ribosomal protein L10 [candidate division Zixibacteria bacterium]